MELIKADLPDWRGKADLYKVNDKYYVVSTIIFGDGVDPEERFMLEFGNIAGRMLGFDVAEIGEEETVVFNSNEQGDNLDTAFFGEHPIHVSGEGSRDKVLDQLRCVT
jgi:hypothetical protein